MDETPRHDAPRTGTTTTTTPPPARTGGRGMLWGLIAVVLAFLIGFFWQFYQATTVRQALSGVERELVVERLRVQLASSAIAAQQGDYESARQGMSRFFNSIQAERWAFPPELERPASEFLAMRDDVITGLSRGNPEYAGVLFGMLDRFEAAVPADGAQPAAPGTAPARNGDPPGP